ncbi:MAG: VapC toxin family PIN domain ribonuclease [Candidatus Aminicenantes bacterium]|jgi:predicted nucleic acid-binding protein
MVLADTSIWVSHFRDKNPPHRSLLMEGQIICHPFIIGDLACGNLKNRDEILSLLEALPAATKASHEEIMRFIDRNQLMGIDLDYVDVHLLASARLSTALLWTKNKNLKEAADLLHIAFHPV